MKWSYIIGGADLPLVAIATAAGHVQLHKLNLQEETRSPRCTEVERVNLGADRLALSLDWSNALQHRYHTFNFFLQGRLNFKCSCTISLKVSFQGAKVKANSTSPFVYMIISLSLGFMSYLIKVVTFCHVTVKLEPKGLITAYVTQ